MKSVILFLMIAFSISCDQTQSQSNQPNPSVSPTPQVEKVESNVNECKTCDFDFAKYKGELKKEEVEGLLLALNDEYLAFATYDQINKDFNNPRPFINIRQAESKHSERLKQLLSYYKIDIPENVWLGKTPKFPSISDACKAGVEAEIANRELYDKLFKSTSREDILIVYRALQNASEQNHLPAFQRCAEGRGMGNQRGKPF